MKKIITSVFIAIVFIIYSLHQRSQTPVMPTSTTTSPMTPTAPAASTVNVAYKDGEYTGPAADAYYGNIQVKVIVSGGKISDVQFLQYPNDRRDSIQINSQAMPLLKQEAIQAQSANVNGVTGATDTSQAFMQSLGTALRSAQS
ncbi:MAG: FMN-binding protein [Candidatus Saccharimonadales bacterium]